VNHDLINAACLGFILGCWAPALHLGVTTVITKAINGQRERTRKRNELPVQELAEPATTP
jgi:hypothetical protein